MQTKDEAPWEGRCFNEAHNFALRCAESRDSNPYKRPTLEAVMIDVATELWDLSFSQTEIRTAFERAVSGLIPYAAGKERRSDG